MSVGVVYVHLDRYGVVLYVGRSGRGRRRAAEHQAASAWWAQTASTIWFHAPDWDGSNMPWWVLVSMESLLIHYCKPKYNQRRVNGDHYLATYHLARTHQLHRLPGYENLLDWFLRVQRARGTPKCFL